MLVVEGVRKTYSNGIRALRGLDLVASPGILGLLGPNGAGKSTLMKILATLLHPDAGRANIDGVDIVAQPTAVRARLGYLPQDFGLYPTFTAEQMLDYFARLKGIRAPAARRAVVDALLDRVALGVARQQRVGSFSGGMRQRLGIAQALIARPRLLIVDEPTAGLDPEERVRFHNLLAEVAEQDTIVLLSTHIVADVASLCSALAIIKGGEIIASGTPAQSLDTLRESIWEAIVTRNRAAELRRSCAILSSQLVQGQVRLRVRSPGLRPADDFVLVQPSLEDFYLLTMGSQS